jgi:hypothetical protein
MKKRKAQLQTIIMLVMFLLILIGIATEAVTLLQTLPILIAIFLGKMTQLKKMDSIYVISLSVVMLLVNTVVFSFADIVLWAALGYSFWRK